MSAQKVLEEMVFYYESTGKVMKNDVFVSLVVSKFETDEIIEGLMAFSDFLDGQRIVSK